MKRHAQSGVRLAGGVEFHPALLAGEFDLDVA